MTQLWMFEDEAVKRFLPLTATRAMVEVRCGIFTIVDAVERAYGVPANRVLVRDYLRQVVAERMDRPTVAAQVRDETVLLLNARVLAGDGLEQTIPLEGDDRAYVGPDGQLVAARLSYDRLGTDWMMHVTSLPVTTTDVRLLSYPWEIFQNNQAQLERHAVAFELGNVVEAGPFHLMAPEGVHVAPDAEIEPGVVLDARLGPIVIDAGALVMANSVVQGPCYVGADTQIKIGSKIYHGTTIGPNCKVGGEVENSVFLGRSNKQHDGFLGHAIIGEWCNLGADTNNSDLKNNYSNVRAWCAGEWVDTGSQFVGVLMGDHSKTGISTSLNTGTVVGAFCNIFGIGLPPKYVPSFSWGGVTGIEVHRLKDAIDTAARVMARRAMTPTTAQRELFAYLFEQAMHEHT